MKRGWALTFGGLVIWAGWFIAAYGLHGVRCARGPVDPAGRLAGQWVQITLWLAALGAAAIVLWLTHAKGFRQPSGLLRPAFWLNVIGLIAIIYTGAAVILIAPC